MKTVGHTTPSQNHQHKLTNSLFFKKEGKGERAFFSKNARNAPSSTGGARDGFFFSPCSIQAKRANGKSVDRDENETGYIADHLVQGLKVGVSHSLKGGGAAIQRTPKDWVLESTGQMPDEANISNHIYYLEATRADIYELVEASWETRVKMKAQCDPTLTEELYANRNALIPLLEERVAMIQSTITDIYNYLENKGMSEPGDDWFQNNMESLAREGDEQKAYLNRLKRWSLRQRMTEINEVLSQQSNPKLEAEKKEIAQVLLSTATEFKQFAKPWKNVRYGTSSSCTTIGQAGCGPTSLAIILEMMYQEDPEMQRHVDPLETADYAKDYGRVCNSGTAGDKMMGNISKEWAEYDSIKLAGVADAERELQNGNLILFLCKGCKGKTESGKKSSYGGHYMVLSGVSDDGQTFNVLDPGRNDRRDINTISRQQLNTKTKGFWMVYRTEP